jgi:tRNA-guanine family transglycosylase
MRLSMRWAERSKEAFGDRPGHALFGIQQGGVTRELREESAEKRWKSASTATRSAGSPWARGRRRCSASRLCARHAARDRPRYLMGVGKPDDIVGAVKRGIDMMDCVLPSRSGRTGQAFTRRGVVNIKNARHADDPRPLDEECTCPACRGYSRAYLHHVFRPGEIIASMLLTWHNLHYYQELMAGMRAAIAEDRFAAFEAAFHAAGRGRYRTDLTGAPSVQPAFSGRFSPRNRKGPPAGERPAGQVGRDQGMPRPVQGTCLFEPRGCAVNSRRLSLVRPGAITGVPSKMAPHPPSS